MSNGPSLVWFRNDLRLHDNPALQAALERGNDLVLLYVHDEQSPGSRPLGGRTRWWLHHSLIALGKEIRSLGGELVLRTGAGRDVVAEVAASTRATAVFWNRRYGAQRDADAALKSQLREQGLVCESFAGNLLFEPWTIRTGDDRPFKVFTPFWRACLAGEPPRTPIATPASLPSHLGVDSDTVETWGLDRETPDSAAILHAEWTPGERGATVRAHDFLDNTLAQYHRRDEPGVASTSRLSPHLRFGEISPHTLWHALEGGLPADAMANKAKFLSEIGWREFSYNILFHSPDISTRNYRPDFDRFPWGEVTPENLQAWHTGTTGIPLVDAGMRELQATGYMHNRVRMVSASFLVKNMLADWRVGEQWFWENLVDADEANNPASWQWVAGSGADAAPYFRVFNPVLQAEKFDPHLVYISRWVPEIGTDAYPSEPIVDLKTSRTRALAAFAVLKEGRSQA